MKVALITDLHFGARDGSTIILNHQKKFYEDVFIPYLDKNNINTVICLGDTFDKRKYTNNYVIEQCKQFFFDKLKEKHIEIFMIVGNHDAYFKNTLFPNTPDLILAEYDNVNVISYPVVVSVDGFDIAMIPWICQENYDASYEVIKNSKSDICMGHFEISGFKMNSSSPAREGLSRSLFDRYDTVFSGHYHHRSTQDNITYLGTAYEMTWQDFNDPKGFHIFDLHSRQLEFIQNPYQLHIRITYNDEELAIINSAQAKDSYVKLVVVKKTDQYKFDTYLQSLYDNGAIDVKIIEDIGDFTGGSIDVATKLEDTQSILNQYVESTNTDADKEQVKNYIQMLYTEALNIET